MLRALWFLLKIAALVAAIVWLTRHPGTVEISWQGYLVETSVSFAVAAFAGVLVFWMLIYRFWRSLVSVPAALRRARASALREKGYLAVTRGLVAVAAGDGQGAEKYAQRAQRMIPAAALTRLLIAQTALMNGDIPKARREFSALLEDETAAFFGVRGLLNEALEQGNDAEALAYIRKAEQLQPKRLWILRTLFDLETRNREWEKAESTLNKALRLQVFDRAGALSHRQALWLARAEEETGAGNLSRAAKLAAQAHALDPGFVPAAVRLARLYDQAGKRRKALKVIEKSWAQRPHPDLAELWMKMRPPPRKLRSIYDEGKDLHAFVKKLYDLHPQHRDSQRALGLAALEGRLWREAREHLQKAGDYRALAKLERAETGNEAKAREWLERAADAQPDPKWVCRCCGHAALDWSALCRHCGNFNSHDWIIPNLEGHEPVRKTAGYDRGFLAPPAS